MPIDRNRVSLGFLKSTRPANDMCVGISIISARDSRRMSTRERDRDRCNFFGVCYVWLPFRQLKGSQNECKFFLKYNAFLYRPGARRLDPSHPSGSLYFFRRLLRLASIQATFKGSQNEYKFFLMYNALLYQPGARRLDPSHPSPSALL